MKEPEEATIYAFEMAIAGNIDIDLLDQLIASIDLAPEAKQQIEEWRHLSEKAFNEGHFDYALALAQSLKCVLIYAKESFTAYPLARAKHRHTEKQRDTLAKKARPARKTHDWAAATQLEEKLLASGHSPRSVASLIQRQLGIPARTYRERRAQKNGK